MGDKALLSNADEILFRQIHPSLIDNGEPYSAAFIPSDADEGQLSVDRSSITSAQASYELFVANGYLSGCVYGVAVGDFHSQGLTVRHDPLPADGTRKANPAHALVDYSAVGTNQRRKIGKRMKAAAISRGVLYSPPLPA